VAELTAALEAQQSAFRRGAPDYKQRLAALRKLERALVDRQPDIIHAISTDFGGRAAEETIALELFPTLNEIRYAISHLKEWMQPVAASVGWQFWPAGARIMYQPVGVVGILSAWNYPLFLSFAPAAGAIAAGNHVMLKPSELAPATAELMRAIIADLFPPDYFAVIPGDAALAAEFAALPFDHLLYTGSARVGKLVMRAASENLTPVTLELGGKSPALVHRDYPIDLAADRIMAGKLYNAGQTCVAPDYALIAEDRVDEFIAAARAAAERMYPRLANNADYTRIINATHYRRLRDLVDQAASAGARLIEINPASELCNEENRVFPPTLLLNAPPDAAIMQDEIFGPLLPIIPYRDLDDALVYINGRPRPLSLYYFDTNSTRTGKVLAQTTSGGATVNDCMFHVGQPCLPFGGTGASGMGHYHGRDGFLTFSKKKGIFLQSRWTPLAWLRPPYSDRARKLLRFIVGS
jgi:coniferyl-aldehyde dehydrogenase